MTYHPTQVTRFDVTSLFVSPEDSIREVFACLDRTKRGIALIVGPEQRLLGTITEGDMRRAVLTNIDLDEPARLFLERKKGTLYETPITAPAGISPADLLRLMRQVKLIHMPLVNPQGQVVDLVRRDDLIPEDILPLRAVVMAGGFGTRLHPLTEALPKPMLPVGDRPLLELIVEHLRDAGIRHVNITTHYKSEKITQHFGDGREFGVELNYVSEDKPLGTAGALSLLETSQEPFLVMNGDILTQVDFRAMLTYHREHNADLTVAVRQYDLQVPYGVLECDGPYVRQLYEKPTYNFFVNAGIYLLQPTVHRYIPNNQRFDMTDLIETLIAAELSVVSFPIVEYWLDIGQHSDYQQAQEDLKDGRFSS